MFFSLLLALWMTCGVAGAFQGPLVPLRFIEEPTDTVARKNEAVTLNCRVEGSPSPTDFTWKKDGQAIRTDRRIRIGSNGALLISSMTHKREHRSDVGEYQCFASSPALAAGRIASRKVHLEVAGISKKFLYEPHNTTAFVGSIARLSCKVRHAAPPAEITWEKDGSPLISSDRLVILDQGVLQIKNVKKADEGNYRCIASNVAKTRYSQAASLTVQSGSDMDKMSLKFIGVPSNTTVLKGATTVLECAATGYPIPTVRWKKLNGELSVPMSSYGINNLNFTNINETDGGEYECQASSNGQTISRTVWLFVRVPPRFTKKPASFKWTTAEPILLHCAATGSPKPTISWLRNGNELMSNEKTRITYYEGGADLLISSKISNDSGIYQCFAQNEAGSIQASASVIIHKSDDQPGPPTNLVALPYSSSSIVISWSPPIGHYVISAYTVHYKRLVDRKMNEKQEVLGSNTHRYIVSNLQPFTNYSFYVKAYTKAIGRDSKVIVQRTRQGSPTRPPMNVKVTSSTSDSLDVTWQPPPRGYQNGIITKYVINYGEIGQSFPSILEIPGHILHGTINGLSKGRTYSVKVRAETVGGKGPFSKPLNATVLLHSVVISAPTLWIAKRNSSMLNVKWLPPKYGWDLVQGYHLFYVQLQGSKTEKGPFILGKEQRSYFLKNLNSGSEFFIKVMAWDGKILGQPGAVHGTTDRDPDTTAGPSILPPPPPIHLVCSVTSPSSILLTWQHELSAERIAYYTVKYQLSDGGNSEPVEIRVPLEYINLYGLLRKRSYTISVQSHYGPGKNSFPGSLSTTQTQCSIPARSGPSSPRNIKFEYKTVSSVEITWTAPVKKNGDLTSYEIFYAYNNSLSDSKWMVKAKPVQFPINRSKYFDARLVGIKENTTFYIKIRAANQDAYGPFSETVIVKPPTGANRVPPNITYIIVSPRLVKLSWPCPRVFNAFVTSFTIRFTNNIDLPEDKWNTQTVVLGSSERFPNIVTTKMAVDQYTTYHIKVRAEYDDHIPGKWSKIIKISTDVHGMNASATKDPRIAEMEDNPEFSIKLGIIIGCTISAFCIVVLVLFIVWRNPCRQVPVNQGNKKLSVNGLPSHLQQIAVSGTQDNTGSTEETSASSGICQCRCTCGAGSGCSSGPKMVRANKKLPGSSDSTTPITQVFASSTQGGDSEGRLSHQDLRSDKDGYNSGSSSTSTSVELHREDKVLSRNYKQSVSVDV